MTAEEIIDIVKFRTWLKISSEIAGKHSAESWETLMLIDAFLSSKRYPETFYIKDILSFLKDNENEELLNYMKIYCCNGWPIKEEDMQHAEHMFTHRLLAPFRNYSGKYHISILRDYPLHRCLLNSKLDLCFDLHAFYNDFFVGKEYYSMSILKKFVKNINISFSEPLEYRLSPDEISNEYLDIALFSHDGLKTFLKYDELCGSIENKGVNNLLIEEETKKVLNRYEKIIKNRLKSKKKLNEDIRKYIYSKWNFRFKIENDGSVFLFDLNYMADEAFYKNIFHKIIDKKSYRMKNYTKEFNFKMSLSGLDNFLKGYKEYVNYDSGTIELLIY